MMPALVDSFDIGRTELVSFVGGGGKSTLMFALAAELAGRGQVVMTTTTKMGRDQVLDGNRVCGTLADARRPSSRPVMLVTGGDSHKITGSPPADLDHEYSAGYIDYLLVEADGAHGRPLKAPASHEPVVPASTTLVVIAVGVDAIGRPLLEVAHRIERAVSFTGAPRTSLVTPELCAEVILHPEGALRVAPSASRVVVAITKVDDVNEGSASQLADLLAAHRRIDAVALVPALLP